jgi:hypothetical protein
MTPGYSGSLHVSHCGLDEEVAQGTRYVTLTGGDADPAMGGLISFTKEGGGQEGKGGSWGGRGWMLHGRA